MKKILRTDAIYESSAVSSVVGAIFMLILAVLLAVISFSVVYGNGFSSSLSKAPMSVIEVKSIEGGVPNKVKFKENYIVLLHKGGESLQTGNTKIIITGEGSAYTGVFGSGGTTRFGDIFISYDDLTTNGKDSPYASRNPNLLDGTWSAGEELILNGYDSAVGSTPSSVHVTINCMTNTSDNYGLKDGSIVIVKVYDRKTNRLIAECEHYVELAQ
ncbi:type IV pilin N-terminal domain-containing protein [Methanolobus sp. ZRKC2]|uniref:type IV pilin N-terminal domain-containing protein n=1 Tax=Methanolobus sp. ZRKC2 TaxID=3125783 RepID=UPI003244AFE3